ncbi:murein L,D-transpeptidase [Salinivirga cyanobacteriivorans]|uniref:Murein L,D-transpeptidase n=2 Tax=Salinivirga cyanobacteriivorans TaxID=1307839 RepID=A0A0S2HYH4_9BACT|nr:murein L,D-transpeptidase [Salinivirga cyanobacteriivorans]
MFQCKTSEQPVVDRQETAAIDTIQKDSIKVETEITKDTLTKDTTPPKLTPKQLQLCAFDEKMAFFRSLKNEQKINLKYPGKLLRKGDSGIAVIPIKRKLQLLGLLKEDSLTIHFDSSMNTAIKKFQKMHNIRADGIPGRNTFRFLSWPVNKYTQSLEKNRNRIAQQPDSLPATRIEINIPEYTLRFYEIDTVVQQFEVVVGKYKNQTPTLNSKIAYLVFNPCWTVPHSIAVKSILPRLKRDTTFLDNRNMFITENGERKNHHKIDFSQFNKSNFPYKIFQNASPGNALGQVKFMFENSHLVYLHDTPSKYLFNKDFRTFSSGCIRVNHAMELAKLILNADQNKAIIKNKLAKGYPVKVHLNEPIPIIIQYQTARYNEQLDMVQFFYDCYGLD